MPGWRLRERADKRNKWRLGWQHRKKGQSEHPRVPGLYLQRGLDEGWRISGRWR